MADVKKIRVDIDGNSAGLKQATGQANKSLNNLNKTVNKVGGALAGAFAGQALVRGLGQAINKIAEFEKTMRRVAIISKGSEAELSKLAKTLGSTTVFTANQAGEAMTFLAQAGFDANQIMKATPGVLELAAATMIDLASAADIASNVLSAYGMEASELNEINDLLVTTTNNANTNVMQFAEAFKVAGPIAKGAGIEINELAGLIGVLGDAGIQGSLAGTQLKTAIAKLIDPMSDAQAILDSLGVSTKDSSGNLRSLVDIFGDLGRAGLTAEQSFAIFDQRAASGALVMAGAAEKAGELAEKTKEVGVAAEQSEGQLNTLSGDIELLKSAWSGLVLEGSRFNAILRKTVQMVTQLVSIMGDQTDQIDSVTASMIAMADSEEDINGLINAFTMLQNSIDNTDYQNRQYAAGIAVLRDKLKGYQEVSDEAVVSVANLGDKTVTTTQALIASNEAQSALNSVGWEFVSVIDEQLEKETELNSILEDGQKVLQDTASNYRDLMFAVTEFADAEEAAILTTKTSSGIMKENIKVSAAAGLQAAATAAANRDSAKDVISAALATSIAKFIESAAWLPAPWNAVAAVASIALVKGLFANIPAFEKGTSFAPGGTALVGERGPELVNLPRGSSVTPNHQLGGGGSQTLVLNVDGYQLARINDIVSQNHGTNVRRTTF